MGVDPELVRTPPSEYAINKGGTRVPIQWAIRWALNAIKKKLCPFVPLAWHVALNAAVPMVSSTCWTIATDSSRDLMVNTPPLRCSPTMMECEI